MIQVDKYNNDHVSTSQQRDYRSPVNSCKPMKNSVFYNCSGNLLLICKRLLYYLTLLKVIMGGNKTVLLFTQVWTCCLALDANTVQDL